VARAFAQVERAATSGRSFDVVHDHCGFTALAMADRIATPLVHTLHGAFTAETRAFYERHGSKAEIVAISLAQRRTAPPALRDARVIPNPIAVDRCAFRAEKEDYLLWLGRMAECKGPHRAIDVARLARRPIVIAGPIQPGQERFFDEEIGPRLLPGRQEYVGEVSGTPKQQLIARAAALLMPIRWAEPFGMVMIEALAAGTPVIAFPEGAAPEIVIDGENGFLVADEKEMAAATARLRTIDPAACRASVAARYDGAVVARRYVAAYRAARDRAGHAALA
jgi:glycosyltransferase involved in cell wall biosynthesis